MQDLEKQHHEELKRELQNLNPSPVSKKIKKSPVEDTEPVEEPHTDLQQIIEDNERRETLLMPRKKRGLYEAIKVTDYPIMLLVLFLNMLSFSSSMHIYVLPKNIIFSHAIKKCCAFNLVNKKCVLCF